MNIIEAIKDPNLFRPFLGDDLTTWRNWCAALRCLYGLPVPAGRYKVVAACTGRDPNQMPADGFHTALFLTGRRSGKSRTAAIIGAYEAVLAGREKRLSKGEMGTVAIIAPTKAQARIVASYLRSIFETPLLEDQVESEDNYGFALTNGNRVDILAGDWRTVRGFTLLAAIVDELCFFGLDAECKVRSDTELIRAIKPSLATCQGKLVCISSPYAKKGWGYTQYQKYFGNNSSRVLVWNSPSRTMNPCLSQRIVDEALAEDLASAKAEYLGEFRDDIEEYLSRSTVEQVVVKGRQELMPAESIRYAAFADLGGGRVDDAALAIGHRQDRKAVVDCIRRYRPPYNPHTVVGQMAEELKRYRVTRVVGDNYAADFVSRAFEAAGLRYEKADKNKSMLYLELLPRICSREIELLDNSFLIDQIAGLERRTRSGGRDIVDHPATGHDDLANVVAGLAEVVMKRIVRVGGFFQTTTARSR